jgi:hypothetical protein
MAQFSANADLIGFLQALPEGRKRRGVRYPQWLLLKLRCIAAGSTLAGSRRDGSLLSGAAHHGVTGPLDLPGGDDAHAVGQSMGDGGRRVVCSGCQGRKDLRMIQSIA